VISARPLAPHLMRNCPRRKAVRESLLQVRRNRLPRRRANEPRTGN